MKDHQNNCRRCNHLLKPGQSSGYCGSIDRVDLPKAYGVSHPAKKLPKDLGAECRFFESK